MICLWSKLLCRKEMFGDQSLLNYFIRENRSLEVGQEFLRSDWWHREHCGILVLRLREDH